MLIPAVSRGVELLAALAAVRCWVAMRSGLRESLDLDGFGHFLQAVTAD